MRINLLIILSIFSILISSCGKYSKTNYSINNSNVKVIVDFSNPNFKEVDYVSGEAECNYLFLMGGFKKQSIIQKARAEMFKKANLIGTSKVILNENIDFYFIEIKDPKYKFPIFHKVKVTVSGVVYGFTK